jgi:hypothetical protein
MGQEMMASVESVYSTDLFWKMMSPATSVTMFRFWNCFRLRICAGENNNVSYSNREPLKEVFDYDNLYFSCLLKEIIIMCIFV